jgi:hypothetical protein
MKEFFPNRFQEISGQTDRFHISKLFLTFFILLPFFLKWIGYVQGAVLKMRGRPKKSYVSNPLLLPAISIRNASEAGVW